MKNKIVIGSVLGIFSSVAVYHALGKKEEPTPNPPQQIVPGIYVSKNPVSQPQPLEPSKPVYIPVAKEKSSVMPETDPQTRTKEELEALEGDDRQEAVAQALSGFSEIETTAEVLDIKCEEKTCTVNLQSKTTNLDGKFQMAVTHFVQQNLWVGQRVTYNPEKETDNRKLTYVFSQIPTTKEGT